MTQYFSESEDGGRPVAVLFSYDPSTGRSNLTVFDDNPNPVDAAHALRESIAGDFPPTTIWAVAGNGSACRAAAEKRLAGWSATAPPPPAPRSMAEAVERAWGDEAERYGMFTAEADRKVHALLKGLPREGARAALADRLAKLAEHHPEAADTAVREAAGEILDAALELLGREEPK